jgi:type VI protein secretion system component VasA
LYEAISKETLTNALTLYDNWRIIEVLRIEGIVGNSSSPGHRVIRLRYEYQSEEQVKKLIVDVARFRKRTRAYRSRRYQLNSTTDVADAISLVKTELGNKPTTSGRASSSSIANSTTNYWMSNRPFTSTKSLMASSPAPPSPVTSRRTVPIDS